MIDMYSKYDNIHENGIFSALLCINNHITTCRNFMLSMMERIDAVVHCTLIRVKNKTKLTNFIKLSRFEGYNGK